MNHVSRIAAVLILGGALALSAGTPLSKAAQNGDFDRVKELVNGGEQVNERDKWGWTPIMWSVYYKYFPITEFLLSKGADPNLQTEKSSGSIAVGATPLLIAAYYGMDDQADLLVSKGAKPEIADANGKTPLAFATEFSFTGVIEALNKAGKPAVAAAAAPGAPATTATDAGAVAATTAASSSKLSKPYTKLVVAPFLCAPEITKDYPTALGECQANALAVLRSKKGFERVDLKEEGKTPDETTLVATVQITEMRITSGAARFWVGAMAGSSYVKAKVTLVDPVTGKVEREQVLNTENNAFGAAWTGGSSDRSIPKDMGAIVAAFIITTTYGQ